MTNPQVPSRLFAWLRLLRVSNVLTAVADVWMGLVVTRGDLAPATSCVALTAASALLYLSGMALNDAFDSERDARYRPERPIPSGVLSLGKVYRAGFTLWMFGVAFGWLAAWMEENWAIGLVATALALAVLVYNGAANRELHGVVVMGACRGLNVLLGLSVGLFATVDEKFATDLETTGFSSLPLAMTIYVMGLTQFARTEAIQSVRASLLLGTLYTLLGLGMFVARPFVPIAGEYFVLQVSSQGWLLLWGVITLLVLSRFVAAIVQPTPSRVQHAVAGAIQSIIVIDAALAWGVSGPFWGLAILALLPPSMLMARWISPT